MKKYISTILLLMLFISSAFAATGDFSTPDEIIATAKENRIGFINAVNAMEKNLPNIHTRETFIPYLLLLDKLQEIGNGYDLTTMGGDPLSSLGNIVTRYGVRWTDITIDSTEYLETFLKWSKDCLLYTSPSPRD